MSARIVIRLGRPLRRRLKRRLRRTADAALRLRIGIVLHYDRGWGSMRISRALHCAPATAVRVARRFLEQGVEGLLDRRRQNGCPKVDADSLQALAELINRRPEEFGWTRPTWTKELLARALFEEVGLEVSVTTVSRMLKALGARWGRPKPIVVCPWSSQRKNARLRRIRQVLENLAPGEVAYFEDEVDIHLNPKVGPDWMLRGEQKPVRTPGQNEKHYVAGALAIDGSDLVFVEATRKNTDLFLAMLEKLKAHHPRARRIHLVLDNYCIHSSRRAEAFIAKHGELFQLHFLPPYCPDHNRIERLWRELHAQVTRNHRHDDIYQLMRAVWAWLRSEAARRQADARLARRHRRRPAA